jgi:ABC-type nitrate/sulfonate/bicarbonate transport system substrate-binding protein/outer membrane protein OmpA-like peptidoglycan-associated protein
MQSKILDRERPDESCALRKGGILSRASIARRLIRTEIPAEKSNRAISKQKNKKKLRHPKKIRRKYMKKTWLSKLFAIVISLALLPSTCFAGQSFKDLAGDIQVSDVKEGGAIQVPYIFWGGDVATFYANGGLKTAKGSIYEKLGLNLNLVAGDDFVQQVRDYMSGKSPFLRGTVGMIAMASELIGSDQRTKGRVILQHTWSAGDHAVSKEGIKTIRDLKGKKVSLQQGGPHVDLLDDILRNGNLTWGDIEVVWTKDLTGPNGPAELFRKNTDIAACFVVTPDMIGLTGGAQSIGTGAEGTVKGARVLVSTKQLSYSIADVYLVRSDFYYNHKDLVEKFVAGFLKGTEDIVDMKKQYAQGGSKEFMKVLKMTQDIYTPELIPTLEEDAFGLIDDATFVGYPGNIAFFTDQNNSHGYSVIMQRRLELAAYLGLVKKLIPVQAHDLDYNSGAFVGYLQKTHVARGERFNAEAVQKEIEELSSGGNLDKRMILSFSINFEPNQMDFSDKQYSSDFDEVLKKLEQFGNAVVAIRGHSDPTKTLLMIVKAGLKKGILKQSGNQGNYAYFYQGKQLDLQNSAKVAELVQTGAFDDPEFNAREVMQAGLNLSRQRAEAVRASLISYAKLKGKKIDESQIQAFGAGVREPLIAKPSNEFDARQNMRVDFSLVATSPETINPKDFDF